jgi:hypothetical protein
VKIIIENLSDLSDLKVLEMVKAFLIAHPEYFSESIVNVYELGSWAIAISSSKGVVDITVE